MGQKKREWRNVEDRKRPDKNRELGDFRRREHGRREMAERTWKNIMESFVMCKSFLAYKI